MKDSFYKNLGKNIKKYRESEKMTQQALANKVGKSLNFMGKIEVSYSRPSLDTLIDIAAALNISVSELTKFDEKAIAAV